MGSQDNTKKTNPVRHCGAKKSANGVSNGTKMDVGYVANLARLYLNEEEVKRLGVQLDDILDYINKLNEVDTKDTQPTSHILPLENVCREDEVKSSLGVNDVLKNAPSIEGNFFKVPKIIE